jgi:lipopolysaccharide transport system permease protein
MGLQGPAEVLRIEPPKGWSSGLPELWQRRELVYFFAWRDIKVRYKQTALGAAWAILQPLTSMVVFTVFFGRLAKVPSSGLPYPVFSLAALVPWTYFSSAVSMAASSMVTNANLIGKIYFPRLAAPVASVLGGLVDLAITLVVLLVVCLGYGYGLGIRALALPLFVLVAIAAALGIGSFLAAVNVRYRDVRYVLPFLLQIWLLATPVAYPSTLVSEPWRSVYALNPMVGVVDGFRWALLDPTTPVLRTAPVSAAAAVVLLVGGVVWFRRQEQTFADVI